MDAKVGYHLQDQRVSQPEAPQSVFLPHQKIFPKINLYWRRLNFVKFNKILISLFADVSDNILVMCPFWNSAIANDKEIKPLMNNNAEYLFT
jgi:hypothetical protein